MYKAERMSAFLYKQFWLNFANHILKEVNSGLSSCVTLKHFQIWNVSKQDKAGIICQLLFFQLLKKDAVKSDFFVQQCES